MLLVPNFTQGRRIFVGRGRIKEQRNKTCFLTGPTIKQRRKGKLDANALLSPSLSLVHRHLQTASEFLEYDLVV